MSTPNSQSESDLADKRAVDPLLTLQGDQDDSGEEEEEQVEEESSLQEQQGRLSSLTVVGPSRTINDLAGDTFFQIFSYLNPWELLLMRRVCRRWKMDVEGYVELWMKLILTKKKGARFTENLMKAALERSNNGLREIVIETGYDAGQLKYLKGLFMKCKDHLTVLDLSLTKKDGLIFEWSDFWKNLPHSKSCKFTRPSFQKIVDIKLKIKKTKQVVVDVTEDYWGSRNEGQDPWLVKEKEKEEARTDDRSVLKVLWIGDFQKPKRVRIDRDSYSVIPLSSLRQLYSLVSLRVETASSSWDWYQTLKLCHRTLKHLDIKIKEGSDADLIRDREGQIITSLEFPNLQVLKLMASHVNEIFPDWFIIPNAENLTFVSDNFWNELPDLKEIWVKNAEDYESLNGRCKSLETVRVTAHKCTTKDLDALIALATQRPHLLLILPIPDGKKLDKIKSSKELDEKKDREALVKKKDRKKLVKKKDRKELDKKKNRKEFDKEKKRKELEALKEFDALMERVNALLEMGVSVADLEDVDTLIELEVEC